MFLIEVTINTVLNRLSMEGIALTHWWDNQVISFDPPVYRTSENVEGFAHYLSAQLVFHRTYLEVIGRHLLIV